MNAFNNLTYSSPLITSTFLVMSILFLPLIILIILNFKYIIELFGNIDKKTLMMLFIIFLFGFYLRNTEYRYGMDVDGMYYQEMAKNIYENNLFVQGCALGSSSHCNFYYGSVVLPGYPYLITLLFHIFGVHDIIAMVISGVLGSINIILVFLISYLLFNNSITALASSAIFAFLPLDIYISPTATVRPTEIFFMCLTVVFFLLSLKKERLSLWILTAIIFSFSVYVRLDSYILFFPMAIYLFINNKMVNKKNLAYLAVALIILLVHQAFSIDWLLHNHFGMTGGKLKTFSLVYISNSWKIIPYFFLKKFNNSYILNPFFTLFFIFGLFSAFVYKKERKELFFVIFLFLVFWAGIATFCHGGEYGETIRYLQPIGIPYAVLSGFIFQRISKKIYNNSLIFLVFSIFILSCLFISQYFKLHVFTDKRKEELSVSRYIPIYDKLPPDALVFTEQPLVFNFDFMRGKNLKIASYKQSQFEEYPGFFDSFIKEIEENRHLRWFFITQSCERNKFCKVVQDSDIVAIEGPYSFSLYEILNKDALILKLIAEDIDN